jgi:hypothetical protein
MFLTGSACFPLTVAACVIGLYPRCAGSCVLLSKGHYLWRAWRRELLANSCGRYAYRPFEVTAGWRVTWICGKSRFGGGGVATCVLTILSVEATFIITGSMFTVRNAVKSVFGLQTAELTYEDEEICIISSLIIYTLSRLLRSRVLIPLVTVIFYLLIYARAI